MNAASGHDDVAGRALHVVHVSADFPDSIEPSKTPVIARLVDLAPAPLRHTVYSLNRVSPGILGQRMGSVTVQQESFGYALRYAAPGKGLFHARALGRLGDWLTERIGEGGAPDLLYGHKLTVEGLAVRRAALRLGVPYALTIQGNTDLKILRMRPDLRPQFRAVFQEAAYVSSFAPWSLQAVEQLLGRRAGPSDVVPCPPDFDDVIAPDPSSDGLLSVFHLHNSDGKNLPRMVAAMRGIRAQSPGAALAIVGGGSDADIARCRKTIGDAQGVTLAGAMDRHSLRQRMNGSAGLVLPSLRESFGLVFVEALLSGLPIVYPKGAAVDGYFGGCGFAIPVDARSTEEIAWGMQQLLENSAALKTELAEWQKSAAAKRFLPAAIGEAFRRGIYAAA